MCLDTMKKITDNSCDPGTLLSSYILDLEQKVTEGYLGPWCPSDKNTCISFVQARGLEEQNFGGGEREERVSKLIHSGIKQPI